MENHELDHMQINISGLIINVVINNKFEKIKFFINKFRNDRQEYNTTSLEINFQDGYVRKVQLSEDWNSLTISGNDIDDLLNPFNLIGIAQAIFRFSAIHLAPKGIFLLHGSSAALDAKIVCFGDDGASTAKTLGSLEVALESKNYVADEFCFLNTQSMEVYGYQIIPIHIRPIVKHHLKNFHRFTTPKNHYKKTQAGEFVEQNKLFNSISGKLSALVYIHFSEGSQKIELLKEQESLISFKFCIASHIAKLIHPELDRMQFSMMGDTIDNKIIDYNLIDEILIKISNIGEITSEILKQLPSYKLTISNPCQITPMLRKILL